MATVREVQQRLISLGYNAERTGRGNLMAKSLTRSDVIVF